MTPAEIYAWLKILNTAVTAALADAAAAAEEYRAGVRARTLETDMGTVSVTRRAPSVQIDPDLFLGWVREHRPDELVETVRPAFAAAWAKTLIADGDEVIDPTTGETVTYARVKPGIEYLTFRADKAVEADAVTGVRDRLVEIIAAMAAPTPLPEIEETLS